MRSRAGYFGFSSQMNHFYSGREAVPRNFAPRPGLRHLHYEQLEDRRLLANFTVTNLLDSGPDSLRQAILDANALSGADTINFGSPNSLTGTIPLMSELQITDRLTIEGPGADLLAIDAGDGVDGMFATGDGWRIFRIDDGNDASNFSVEIRGLTLTGGDQAFASDNGGGAIYSGEDVTLSKLVIDANAAMKGAGIFGSRGNLSVIDTTIRGNNAGSGNGVGGGIDNQGSTLTVRNSLVYENTAGSGGGISSSSEATITNSTIFRNNAVYYGGGVFGEENTTVRHSTVTGNYGGGVFGEATLYHSIVARNYEGDGSGNYDDVQQLGAGLTAQFSLIGNGLGSGLAEAPVGSPDGNGNLVGGAINGAINPLLGLLAHNGGLTMTHALLMGSPAIDAGDLAAEAGMSAVPQFDQRGAPFTRVLDGDGVNGLRIDMGSFEAPTVPPQLPGDYNLNRVVDAADYTVWRDTLGTAGLEQYEGADGSGNGEIDEADYEVWRMHYGESLPPPGAGGGAAAIEITDPAVELGEAAAPMAAETISVRVETKVGTTSRMEFAMFEARSARHDVTAQSLERNHVLSAAKPTNDSLLLALAIDRIGRTPRQHAFVVDNLQGDGHLDIVPDFQCLTDGSLDLALTEWQRACVLKSRV